MALFLFWGWILALLCFVFYPHWLMNAHEYGEIARWVYLKGSPLTAFPLPPPQLLSPTTPSTTPHRQLPCPRQQRFHLSSSGFVSRVTGTAFVSRSAAMASGRCLCFGTQILFIYCMCFWSCANQYNPMIKRNLVHRSRTQWEVKWALR